MFRKISTFLVMTAAFSLAAISVSAQSAPVSGKVEKENADGTREPVANALIEVYRVDIRTGFPSARTNRRGEFSFAGLPYMAQFVFAVSAPGCAPTVFTNVRAGMDRILITMYPGDGSKLSEADVRAGATGSTGPDSEAAAQQTAQSLAEQKKAEEEYKAKLKEVEDKNVKAKKVNEIVGEAIKTGNAAYEARNYDLAITKYTEGINADPIFAGTAPILMNNRSTAYRMRGVNTYNTSVKTTEVEQKAELQRSAKADFAAAAEGFLGSWNILKNASPADFTDKNLLESTKAAAINGAIETFRVAATTGQVDDTMIEAAKAIVPEYIKIESDSAKKAQAMLVLGDLYREAQQREEAVTAYRALLEKHPDHIDGMVYLGLVLVDLSWVNDNDKDMAQEGANLLQKFVAVAPDTHRMKDGAKGYLDILKAQNVVPVRQPTTTRRRN
jgi:tetratricopeptide (TPR) repeat protein